jgi:Rrf2 family protein
MLPKKTKYAIKALVLLAKRHGDKTPLKITEIAELEKIPRKFLETILLELRKQGILKSKMGVNGGYLLMKDPHEIFLSTIIRVTGGPIALLPCASLNFYETCDECIDEAVCGLRNVILDVREASLKILSGTSISDLVEREEKLAHDLRAKSGDFEI